MNKILGWYMVVLFSGWLAVMSGLIGEIRAHKGPMFIVEYDENCETLCAKTSFGNKRFAMTREEYRQWQIKQAAGESL